MKTRNGFVANSSSSSFLVAVTNIPQTLEEAGEAFFGEEAEFVAPVIIKGLFNGLKKIEFDVNELIDKLRNTDLSKYEQEWVREQPLVDYLISQLINIFKHEEENQPYGKYGSVENEAFTEYVNKKLKKKYPVYPKEDYQKYWKYKNKVERSWYAQKEVKQRYEWFVNDVIYNLKGSWKKPETVKYMMGEFEDDTRLGAELECGPHWDRFLASYRFNHH